MNFRTRGSPALGFDTAIHALLACVLWALGTAIQGLDSYDRAHRPWAIDTWKKGHYSRLSASFTIDNYLKALIHGLFDHALLVGIGIDLEARKLPNGFSAYVISFYLISSVLRWLRSLSEVLVMVQKEPNLTLTLEALGSSGALLSTEVKVSHVEQ